MCCNGMRIILMFTFTILAFVLNKYISTIPIITWYLISINIFTLLLMVIDKYHSIKGRKRVPLMNLYFFSIAGGFLGLIIAMLLTKHKLSNKAFLLWQILITMIWMITIIYILTHMDKIQNALAILAS